jgi:DNA-binding YbaB/EbfC family protein
MTQSSASGSGQADFGLLAERARQLRHQLEQARDDMGQLEARGLGGSGLVQATVSGENVLVALTIDSSVIDPDDPETLSELVREAVNDATVKLAEQRGQRVSSITDGFAGMLSATAARKPSVTPMTASRRHPPHPGSLS